MALSSIWGNLNNRRTRRAQANDTPDQPRPNLRWRRLPLRIEALEQRIAPHAGHLQPLLDAHGLAAETRDLAHADVYAVPPAPAPTVTVVGDAAEPDAVTVDFELGGFVWQAGDRQVVYLETGGATADYDGPITVEDVPVPAFAAPGPLAGQEAAVLDSLLATLKAGYPAGVEFTTTRPAGGAYSTIYVGGDSSPFAEWGLYHGLAERVDAGNLDRTDEAFVFSGEIDATGLSAEEYGRRLAAVVGHEAGHLLGAAHEHGVGDPTDPLAAVAFDPKVHVAIGNDVLADVLADGKVTINGIGYTVHPKIVAALTANPSYYNAGVVGPDGFPDSIMGQFVVHAEQNATWLTRILDMAWKAQTDTSWNDVERSQILAFAYGYLTHSTGDHWAHTLVNEFTEGIAPGFVAAAASVPGDRRDLGNMVRHFMTEAYIADALEGVDMNPARAELTPGGDVSDDSTPGINYDAPVRFIYEALIRPFPNDLAPILELDWDGGILTAGIVGTHTFFRAAATLGGGLSGLIGDDIEVGNVITVSGFDDPANNGKFRVTAVAAPLANTLATQITVARIGVPNAPLVPEIANGDEKIVVYVPKTPVMALDVNPAAGTITRAAGSFEDEGFVAGMRFSAFGFNANFDNFIVKTVTPTVLTVVGKLNPGDGAGSGDEQLVVQGDRGPILNAFFLLRDTIYTKAVERGDRPAAFGDLVSQLIDKAVTGQTIDEPFRASLFTAYLYQWADSIDAGVRNWALFGQAFTRAMFDPQSRRDLQNKIGAKFGADTLANTARGDAENDVGFLKVLVAELDDPNGDGSTRDSFINNHLLAMAGLPPQLGILRTAVQGFAAQIDAIFGETEQPFNPAEVTPAQAEDEKEGFLKRLFTKRFNVDFDTIDVLHNIHARMDVKTITVGSAVIPVFKANDHEKLDAYMGMPADHHVTTPVAPVDNVEFHPGALGVLADDAHFDKTAFAAYKNSVTLTKMALLMELPPDGPGTASGQLSALYTDLTPGPAYNFALLNLHGQHGGNVLTTTLPGVNGTNPWLASIDADQGWRADSHTTTTAAFRISTQNDTETLATWQKAVPAGEYKVYATWQANVTQDLDNLDNAAFPDQKITPASNAKYKVFNGASPFAVVTRDQRQFAAPFEHDGLVYVELGTFDIASGDLKVELSNLADGHVVAGPILIEAVVGGARTVIQNSRDLTTMALVAGDYSESAAGWTDLVYPTGGGNNPLWESALLRPAFDDLFTDWRNGASQFPALGDGTSLDPNAGGPAATPLGSHATPFGPAVPTPTLSIPIPTSLKNLILDGLDDVVGFVEAIEGVAPFSTPIPGFDKSMAQLLNLSDRIDDALRKPIVAYFANDPSPTVGELYDVIEASIGGKADAVSPVLEFDVDFRKMFTVDGIKLALGAAADAVGLELNGTLDVAATAAFVDASVDQLPKLTFGIDLTPGTAMSLTDRVYVKADRAVLTADINASNLNFGARFGFLGVGVVNGSVDLAAGMTLTFTDPTPAAIPADNRITLTDITTHPIGSIISPAFSGTLAGNLPIGVSGLPGIPNGSVGTATFGSTDLSDPGAYFADFDAVDLDVLNFNNIDAASLVGLLGQLTFWLDEFRRSDAFQSFDLPVVGPVLDKVLGVADAFRDKILIDDRDNGVDDAKTLLFDLNGALAAAGLGARMRFEKAADGKLRLVSNDADIASFDVTASAGAVGFVGTQSSSGTGVFKAITATNPAPVDGRLPAGLTGDQLTLTVTLPGPAAFNGATAVDPATDRLTLTGHGLTTGQAVSYRNGGGTTPTGLTNGTTYFVIKVDDNQVRLAATLENATAATPVAVDITADGAGAAHELRPAFVVTLDKADTDDNGTGPAAFDGAAAVDPATDQITLPGHGLTAGQAVTYRNGGGTSVVGLTDGTTYFVIRVDDGHIKLASSAANATAGTPVDITADGAGAEHTVLHGGVGDDQWKLVDGANAPTFDTVQQMVLKLTEVFGVNDLAYNPANQSLTWSLDLSETFGDVNLPLDFSLDQLPEFLNLQTTGNVRVLAAGGLNLTLGVFLGAAGEGTKLQPTDLLTEVNGGVNISTDQRITGTADVRTVFGQLSGDAKFAIAVNGGPAVNVTVLRTDTNTNTTAADLVADINNAIQATSATLFGQVRAAVVTGSQRVRFVAQSAAVTSFTLTTTSSDPTAKDVGFLTSQSSAVVPPATLPEIQATKDLPTLRGRLSGDAAFNVSLNNVNGGAAFPIVVTAASTATNRFSFDIVGDVQAALDSHPALKDLIEVSFSGNRLVLAAKNGAATFTVSGANTVTVNELGLADGSGNSVDFVITTRAGTSHNITLDGLTTLGQIVEVGAVHGAVWTQTGGKVSAAIDASGFGLTLTDHTIPDGTSKFRVLLANNSLAAIGLGILAQDAPDPVPGEDPEQVINPDGLIEGTAIAGLTPLDRFFIRATPEGSDPLASVDVDVTTPGGVSASAKFGFVGIGLNGGGGLAGGKALEADLVLRLNEPAGSSDGNVSLAELIDNLDDLGSILDLSLLGGAKVGLNLTVTPAIPGLDLGGTPKVELEALNFGDIFGKYADSIAFTATRTGNHSFTIPDDVTSQFIRGSVIKVGTYEAFVNSLSFAAGVTTVTVYDDPTDDTDTLPAGLAGLTIGTPVTPAVVFNYPDLGELLDFGNVEFNFQSIIDGLQALTDFLDQFEAFDFLDKPLPVAGVSVNDLIDLADKFATAVDEARANPAGTVQFLEAKLKEAFGLDPASTAIQLSLVPDDNGTPETTDDFQILKLDLNLDLAFSESVGLDFDLGEVFEIGGGANLVAAGSVDLTLSVGFNVEDPTEVFLFNDTGLDGTLQLGADDVSFRAAVGPLGVFVDGGLVDLHGTVVPGNKLFHVGFDGLSFVNDRYLIDFGSLGDVLDGFTAEVGGALEVDLPVYFPTDSVHKGSIKLDAALGYSTATGEFTTNFDPRAVDPAGNPIPFADLFKIDLSQFSLLDQLLLGVDGIDLFLEGLQDVMDGQIGGFQLPLIGDKLAGAADVIGDFRSTFVEGFRTALEQLANPAAAFAAGEAVDPVSKILFRLLGPDGANLLLDTNESGTVTSGDVQFVTNIDEPGVAPRDVFFDWDFKLGSTLVDAGAGIGFDIGIPGLGLETTGDINLNINWELALGFGINFADGFYFDIGTDGELKLNADVTVPGIGIKGTLGFLQVTAEEDVDPTTADPVTHLGATFGIDIYNRQTPGDTKLGFTELGRIGIDAKVGADAVVDLAMRLALSSDLVPGAPTNFPSVVADFLLDWRLGDRAAGELVSITELRGGFLKNGLKYVGFDHVGLDLGKYFSDLIGPIVEKIQEVTEPVKPFLDFLTEPLPVISQLAGPTSLLDIAAMSGLVNPGIIKAIEVVDQVIDIAHSINTAGNAIIYFDRWLPSLVIFDAASTNPARKPDLTNPSLDRKGLKTNLLAGLGQFLPQLGDVVGGAAEELFGGVEKMLPGGQELPGFQLPILKDPSQVFGMLMGQPADLVTFTMAALEVKADFSAFFSIFGPLGVSINAEFKAQFGPFKFGYDTFGITQFAGSGFKNPLLLFDGLYVSDMGVFKNQDIDVPELQFDAGLWAAAELNLGIARGGVGGGLFAEIDFDLHDPSKDGRVRIGEIVTNILNEFRYGTPALSPLAMFDITGKLTARLFAFLKINFGFFTLDKKFDITDPITLLDFESNFERFPTLATELPGGVLQLNMGKFAGQRVEGPLDDLPEEFHVKQDGAGKVKVWAPSLGVDESEAQSYSVSSRIIALAGEGDDVVDLHLVTDNLQYELEGNAGNDVIKAGAGTGAAKILGGPGNDTMDGSGGDDLIFGETGDDVIDGKAGRDWLFGDGNPKEAVLDNVLTGGLKANDGNDVVKGGDHEDVVFGHGGSDTVEGGGGNDVVIGDGGQVTVGPDRIVVTLRPAAQDPTRRELKVEDTAKGNGGGDTVRGDGGADHLYGGGGGDVMEGGTEGDVVYGEAGQDSISAGAGDDVVFGDFGTFKVINGVLTPITTVGGESDVIAGDGDHDQLLGGAGDDSMTGGAGNDWAWGGTGKDTMDGGNDADHLYGQADPDLMYGGDGGDFVEGGHSNDTGFGGLGNDFLVAGYGSDVLDGEAGSDAYQISARGGSVTELTTAYDSGTLPTETDSLTLIGTPNPDTVLLRAMGDFYFPTNVKLTGDASSDGLTDKIFKSREPDKLAAILQAVEDSYGPHDIPAGMIDALITLFANHVRGPLKAAIDTTHDATVAGAPTKAALKAVIDEVLDSDTRGKLAELQARIKTAYGTVPMPGGMTDALIVAFQPADALRPDLEAAIDTRYVTELVALGADTDTGFVALINDGGADVERFNYRHMEGLVVNTLDGEDYVVLDDVIAAATVNLGLKADRVQIGQVFRSERTRDFGTELITGITAADVFSTTEITRGWLSNGVSRPTTVNGGDDNDEFTVFRNVAVLNLNGGDGDDLFTVRAFALKGSSDSERARTDMKGDGGADTILYVVNAPVGIDGGDGFDTVRVIGTEFSDDFVVTDSGVFGAGLNVSYVNIEKLIADGAEGDDRYFVLSTGLDVVTEIDGGLGSDTFFVGGNPSGAPIPVISDDLRGHSGIVLHSVESTDTDWAGLKVEGLSANVGDDEDDLILVTESGGSTRVAEGATTGGIGWEFDGYGLRLSRAPGLGQVVTINVILAGMSPEDRARQFRDLEFFAPHPADTLDGAPNGLPLGFDPLTDLPNLPALQFDGTNWQTPQYVKFRAADQGRYRTGSPLGAPFGTVTDTASEGRRFAFINHTAQNSTDPDFKSAQSLSVKVQMEDNDRDGVLVSPTGRGNTVLEGAGGFTDSYDVVLNHQPSHDVTVNLSVLNGQVTPSATSLTFTPDDWFTPQTVTLTANDDGVKEGFHTDYISFTVASADVTQEVPLPGFIQIDGDFDLLGVQEIPADKPTSYLLLPHKPVLTSPISVKVNGAPLDPARFSVSGNTINFRTGDGTSEQITGIVEAQYTYVEAGYGGAQVRDAVVDIYDNDAPTVIIEETNGSTDVIEGLAVTDTYRVRLSAEPDFNVTVKADAVQTRTTYGRTTFFEEQVTVNGLSVTSLTFTPDNWDEWQTVTVAAKHDTVRDGNDTQVFAPDLQTVNKIRGPLILEGAAGAGSLSLPAPLMLPTERNVLEPDGNVVSFDSVPGGGSIETMVVEKVDLAAVVAEFATETSTIDDIQDLIGKTLEMSKGPGTGVVLDPARPQDLFDRFWLITRVEDLGNTVRLSLQNPTIVDPDLPNVTAPTPLSEYAITSLSINFFADEREQVDYLFVFDEDSVADDVGTLTSSDGPVLGFVAGGPTDTMTVDTAALLAVAKLVGVATVEELATRRLTITVGPGVGRTWTIATVGEGTVAGTKVLTLTPVGGGAAPTDRSEFRIAGGDRKGRIVGLGMGPNILFNGRPQPGGITYGDIEVAQVGTGSGNDTIRVDYTTHSDDHTTERDGVFYTQTLLDTGAGNDTVTLDLVKDDGLDLVVDDDGAISVTTQGGNDTVVGGASTLPLVVFGGDGSDSITGGTAADILFGDTGRVDYVNEDGQIITRLGHSVPPNPVNPPVTAANANTLTDSTANFSTEYGGLVGLMVQAISPEGTVQFRRVIANTATTITVDRNWDTIPVSLDPTRKYFYRVSAMPEDQTDGTERGPQVIWSINRGTGAGDDIVGGAGADRIFGGAGADDIAADAGADTVFADNGRIDLTNGVVDFMYTTDEAATEGGADTVTTAAGDDVVFGGVAGDSVLSGDGKDVVFGDGGRIDMPAAVVEHMYTTDAADGMGGSDVVDSGADDDIVFGGEAGDSVSAGAGRDLVFGDNGRIDLVAGVIAQLYTTDTTEGTGGADSVGAGAGNDIVLGGVNGDTLHGDADADKILGDNGTFIYNDPAHPGLDTLDIVRTLDVGLGGPDTIDGDGGTDLVLAGRGGDTVRGGTEDDIVFGDFAEALLLENLPSTLVSTDITEGGADDLYGNQNDDLLVGGASGDRIDGDEQDDLIFGDAVQVHRRPGVITDPRFRALLGTQIYSKLPATAGADLVDGVARNYRDPDGTAAPSWAEYQVQNLFHSPTEAGLANSFGDDYIAGGAHHDVVFGQFGNDTVQGDGSIDGAVAGTPVLARREADNSLTLVPSFELPTDGDDYIEGNGGNDTAFGGLGQDDIVGGSSDLYTLNTRALRPDGADMLFGGAGTHAGRNDAGTLTGVNGNELHARDADVLAGDNADLFQLVATNGPPAGQATTGFLAFEYDKSSAAEDRGALRIIPRAVRLLDYTPGGPDVNPTAAANDIGGNDETHGESGDDIAYGMKGHDVLFGDGQDDDLIGNYGNDWISGGTGQDGVIGDDGRVYTSRNSATIAEPLNGIATLLATDPSARTTNGNVLNEVISTPGNVQQATINVGGALAKSVDLTPFSVDNAWDATRDEFGGSPTGAHNSDDMIYGGLGGDFLHGGSGDDAVSGAEAPAESYTQNAAGTGLLRTDFGHPFNPGNALRFNPLDPNGPHFDRTRRAGEFALYDEYDPRREIRLNADGTLNKTGGGVPFFLNFTRTEGPAVTDPTYGTVNTDGNDAIFGDLGNDWLVGGTGRDNAYGGWGNDLHNLDDDHTTGGGLNDTPDTHPSYEDRAYGGAGRDVLIGNTGGDRLIDWTGEFNTYLVPFSPFGFGTVSRALQPQLPEFLYALSKADGADPTRAADTNADPLRNGEPFGELGLVRQQDFAWQTQTGAPSDPQAGNIPGGQRDVLRSASFNNGQLQGFAVDSGKWAVQGAALSVSADSPHEDAVAVYHVGDALPTYFELRASILAIKPTAGWNANAYLVFDYNTATDFKFAGVDVSTNKLVMGRRTAAGWQVDRQTPFQAKPDTYYNLLLSINGTTATLVVDNRAYFAHAFQPRVVEGYSYGLNWGLVGMGSNNARGAFDNVAVQVLPPQITLDETESFDDGQAQRFTGEAVGSWVVAMAGANGRYVGVPPAGGDRGVSLVSLDGKVLNTNSYLEVSGRLSTQGAGGFAFDAYGADDFKFVYADPATGTVVVGHRTARAGWVADRTFVRTVLSAADFDLGVSLKGNTVSVTVNGQAVGGHVYNGVVVDGGFGVLTRAGSSSFDAVRFRTNDLAFAAAAPLRAAAMGPAAPAPAVTGRALAPIVREALRRWAAAGAPAATLATVRVVLGDLPGALLAQTQGGTITIDRDAAGHGWYVDPTPRTDREFARPGDQGEQNRMDLLTTVMHEIGHVLGRAHEPAGLMAEELNTGERMGPAPVPPAVKAAPAAKAVRGGWFLTRFYRR